MVKNNRKKEVGYDEIAKKFNPVKMWNAFYTEVRDAGLCTGEELMEWLQDYDADFCKEKFGRN